MRQRPRKIEIEIEREIETERGREMASYCRATSCRHAEIK